MHTSVEVINMNDIQKYRKTFSKINRKVKIYEDLEGIYVPNRGTKKVNY